MLAGVTSIQFGAALAATLFDDARAGRRVAAAPGLRARSCSSRSGARGSARTAPSTLRLAASFGARARRDEPDLLRGARPHPARHRGDDRVHRADRGRRRCSRAAGWTSSGSRSRRCGIVLLADAVRSEAGSTASASCSRSSRRSSGRLYILLAQRAEPRLRRRRRGSRSRWSSPRSCRWSRASPRPAATCWRRAAGARPRRRAAELGDPLLAGDRGAAAACRPTSSAC